jgi:hypothetical protein
MDKITLSRGRTQMLKPDVALIEGTYEVIGGSGPLRGLYLNMVVNRAETGASPVSRRCPRRWSNNVAGSRLNPDPSRRSRPTGSHGRSWVATSAWRQSNLAPLWRVH